MAIEAKTPTQLAQDTGQNVPTYDASGNFSGNTIPVSSLSSATPLKLATPTPDTTNYNGIIAGSIQDLQNKSDTASANVDALTSANSDTSNADSTASKFLSLMGDENNKAKDTQNALDTSGATALSKQLSDLNAQAKNLNLEAQAIPLEVQQNALPGSTRGGNAPVQADLLRANALKALSISQQSNVAQGNYNAAKDNAQRIIDLKYLPIENKLATLKQQYEFNKDALTAADQKRATALQALITKQANDLAEKKVSDQRNAEMQMEFLKSAISNGDAKSASVITKLDPTSKTYGNDLMNAVAAMKLPSPSAQEYAKAYAAAKGKNDANATAGLDSNGNPTIEGTTNPDSQSILSQTGLSFFAYKLATEGTTALSRMTSAQRTQYGNELKNWAAKNNVDLSTFSSQYKAYNDVLAKNIERANNTGIYAKEVSGTVDQFVKDFTPSDVSKGGIFGIGSHNLSSQNLVDLALGKQVNNPLAIKYSFDLKTLTNDLAGYYAASRGSTQPDQSDLQAAASVISSGINTGSATAFKDAINTNEEKVTNVVSGAVNNTRQQVWSLFGVGDKFNPPVDPIVAKNAINTYIKMTPSEATNISKMYDVPEATDTDIYNYLKANGKLK